MKLVEFTPKNDPHGYPRFGIWLANNTILEIGESDKGSLHHFVAHGAPTLDEIRTFLQQWQGIDDPILRGHTRRLFHLADVTLLPPVRPPFIQDFYAFEDHIKTANAHRGKEVPAEWYTLPVFYYANATMLYGHEASIPYPVGTQALDFELEIACVLKRGGMNIAPDTAEDYILGFTILNDWSARDIQRQEMKVGLGPSKGKDFANSLGPCIVTLDSLKDRATPRVGVYDLSMVARINGTEVSRGNFKDIYFDFGQLIARASQNVQLEAGAVIGSGTVGTGCLLETTQGQGPWLQQGDVVELEIERLGTLRNTIV